MTDDNEFENNDLEEQVMMDDIGGDVDEEVGGIQMVDSDIEPATLDRRSSSEGNGLKRAIFNVPIEVVVSVGTARPLIGDLLAMGRNQLLPLDSKIEDPVELRVCDRVIARGELANVPGEEGQLGIRLTEVINISDLPQ